MVSSEWAAPKTFYQSFDRIFGFRWIHIESKQQAEAALACYQEHRAEWEDWINLDSKKLAKAQSGL
jgi:hypothetical protein